VLNVEEAFNRALREHQCGNLAQAERLYQQILAAAPNHAESHFHLGVLAYQTGRYEPAAESIRQAVALNPTTAIYHYNLGVVYWSLGQMGDAVASYQQCLRLQPDSAIVHNNLGNAFRVLGNLEDAALHCAQALRIHPDFYEAHISLGTVLYYQQHLDDAVAHYQQALRLKPDSVQAKSNLGLVCAEKFALPWGALPPWITEPPPIEKGWMYHAPQMASRSYRPARLAYSRGKLGEDHRLKYLLYFMDVRGQRVLELGPLEGHHSVVLAKMGVRELVALESRPENLAKCNMTKTRHHLANTTFLQHNILALYEGLEKPQFAPGFDLVFCCGLLYHVPNPAKALTWCREQAPALFLGTHYYEPASPESYSKAAFRPGTLQFAGKEYSGMLIDEEMTELLSGMSKTSLWPSEKDLLRMIEDAGYKSIAVLGKDLQNGRPHITIFAEG
jgi:tetratricopeptide (TPR) repeat protein